MLDQEEFDLVIVGIHFDDSRGLEFVKLARQHPKLARTKIVMFRSEFSERADFLRQCVADLAKPYNIHAYVETELFSSEEELKRSLMNMIALSISKNGADQ